MDAKSSNNEYSVSYLINRLREGSLMIDDSYQRRKVWNTGDKVRLIESILNGFLVPPIYLWGANTDPGSGLQVTQVVDGQQRLSSIYEFIEGKYKLSKVYLSEEVGSFESYSDKCFDELSDDDRLKIWKFELTSINLNNDLTLEQIKKVFVRLNLTDYSLNSQEKRHAGKEGLFAEAANLIANSEFWEQKELELFTSNDLKRMGDVQFCSSLLLLARKGMSNESTQKNLNQAYDDYKEEYSEKERDQDLVFSWMNILQKFLNEYTIGFMRKKTQLYSMFCFANYCCDAGIEINDEHVARFEKYVFDYNSFKSEETNDHIPERSLALIGIHKLASSEGIHKLKNRQLRLSVLKEAILDEKFENYETVK